MEKLINEDINEEKLNFYDYVEQNYNDKLDKIYDFILDNIERCMTGSCKLVDKEEGLFYFQNSIERGKIDKDTGEDDNEYEIHDIFNSDLKQLLSIFEKYGLDLIDKTSTDVESDTITLSANLQIYIEDVEKCNEFLKSFK